MILTPQNRIKDYTEKGWWGTDTLYSLFVDACNESGESEALVDAPNRSEFTLGQPKRLTFNQIKIEVDRYASIFYEAGFRKDDKVILDFNGNLKMDVNKENEDDNVHIELDIEDFLEDIGITVKTNSKENKTKNKIIIISKSDAEIEH